MIFKNSPLIISIIMYIVFMTPVVNEWNSIIKAFTLLVIAQLLWIGRVFPMAYTALIVLLLISIHLLPYDEVIGFLGSDIVWLLFSTFIISGGFLKSGLALRVSLHILSWSRGGSKQILLMSFVVMCVLAVLIPTNVGRAGLVASILLGMVKHLEQQGPIRNIAKALFIGLNYIGVLTGVIVMTGSNSSIYAFGIFQTISSVEWTYILWAILFAPPILLFVLLLWGAFLRLYPLEKLDKQKVLDYINEELTKFGRLTVAEIKMLVIISVTVFLWISEPYHGYSVSMIGMAGAVMTMLPVVGIWTWQEAKKEIEWDFLIFFAVSLTIAHMLINSGALEWLASTVVKNTMFLHPSIFIVVFGTVAVALRIIFMNLLGYMSIMLPLALMIGDQIYGMSPILLAMVVLLAGTPGFFLITQSPTNLISYQHGYYTEQELMRTGSVVSVIWLIIVLLTFSLYWSWFHL